MRKSQARISMNINEMEDSLYYKYKQSRFYQQRLPAWRPVPTIGAIICFYSLFSIIFITIGVLLLIYSKQIKEIEIIYNDKCKSYKNEECKISYNIPEDMDSPINIYYKIYGFYQNNRRYTQSKSLKQLSGENLTLSEIINDEDCSPIYTNGDLGLGESNFSADGKTPLNKSEVAIPCGIMAKTYFNDTFDNFLINNVPIYINEKNIAWEKDKELFKNINLSLQWLDIENEHFIVWMRPSGLPDVKKLWGRIENVNLTKGDNLAFTVMNNYDVDKFNGNKSIILSTSNKFGGNNNFLGICFIIAGGISFLLNIAFIINHYIQKHKEKLN